MKVRIGDEILTEHIRVKVRLDYRGDTRQGHFIFGGKSKEQVAEALRDQNIAQLQNIPHQGIWIEDVELNLDVYTLFEPDGRKQKEVAYAPATLLLRVENIDDLLPFLLKPEFRKIEFISPENITIHRLDMERFLFRLSQMFQQEIKAIEQHYSD